MSIHAFIDFASGLGLVISDLIADGRIHSCPTIGKPHKRNGRYRFDGTRGWAQDWQQHDRPVRFESGAPAPRGMSSAARAAAARKEAEERAHNAAQAAQQAAQAIKTAIPGHHPYLAEKGFQKAVSLVLPDGALFIPMRTLTGALIGGQIIRLVDNEWSKKYIFGTPAKGAALTLGRGQRSVLVEGYATGLSVLAALDTMRLPVRVVVTFSAGNLEHVAPLAKGARYVAADNDLSGRGEQAARATGLPWAMPPAVGEDFNDLHQRAGLQALVPILSKLLRATT